MKTKIVMIAGKIWEVLKIRDDLSIEEVKMMGVFNELREMYSLITSDNFKLLNKEVAEIYELKYTGFETRAANFRKDMDNSSILQVDNGYGSLKDDITITIDRINQLIAHATSIPPQKYSKVS